MHNTKAYKTCDGRLFDNEADAASYEAAIKIRDWAKRRNICSIDAISWNLIANAMIEDAAELGASVHQPCAVATVQRRPR